MFRITFFVLACGLVFITTFTQSISHELSSQIESTVAKDAKPTLTVVDIDSKREELEKKIDKMVDEEMKDYVDADQWRKKNPKKEKKEPKEEPVEFKAAPCTDADKKAAKAKAKKSKDK